MTHLNQEMKMLSKTTTRLIQMKSKHLKEDLRIVKRESQIWKAILSPLISLSPHIIYPKLQLKSLLEEV